MPYSSIPSARGEFEIAGGENQTERRRHENRGAVGAQITSLTQVLYLRRPITFPLQSYFNRFCINLCSANLIFQTFVANRGKIPPGISRLLDEIEAKFQRLPPFSMTAIPMELLVKLSVVNGNWKSKMAASKLPKCISQLVPKISTKFQRLYLCFRGPTIK